MSNSSREWDSSVYHRVSAPQVSWGKKVLARLRLRGDETVLDAGCGTGRLTAELLEALPHGRVVALDLSQNMLGDARGHLQADFGSRLHLVAADLLHFPFERSFDGIVSTAAFHWVPDHDLLFLNLRKALRRGGWLEAQCGGGPNIKRFRDRLNAITAREPFAEYFVGFRQPWVFQNAEEAACGLRRAGFVDVKTSVEPVVTVLEDAPKYIEFVRNVILRQHLRYIPEEGLRTQLLENLAEQAAKDDPAFSLDYWRLNLHGKTE